jgi:hypothetical protein
VHHVNLEKPWLDGFVNKLKWITEANVTEGFLYRKINQGGDISPLALSSAQFSAMFKSNLAEVGLDPHLYDTHSFRRGGARYFVNEKRWKILRVAHWGGWSTEWSASTIIRYLVGVLNEDPIPLKDYRNPNVMAKVCNTCGRSCNCSI